MIGFYDSGIGGLNILNEVIKLDPTLDTYYYADTANCPLGEKIPDEITKAVIAGCDYLLNNGCSLVVLACNTATAQTIKFIQSTWLPLHHPNKNVLGVIRPVAEDLIERSIDNESKVLILATKATVNSKFYSNDLKDYGYTNVIELSMDNLAHLIETNQINQAELLINSIFKDNSNLILNCKAVVLACTHYPNVEGHIKTSLDTITSNYDIISQNSLVATNLIKYLKKHTKYATYKNIHNYYSNI
jgi:glutamate racemase